MARLIFDTGVLATRAGAAIRGAHDLIIAACAASAERVLVTTDAEARFHELPDVHSRLLDP